MFRIELVKGKDYPKEIRNNLSYDNGKTGGLLLQLTNAPYLSAKFLILDNYLYDLQALIVMCKLEVFAAAVIKKR